MFNLLIILFCVAGAGAFVFYKVNKVNNLKKEFRNLKLLEPQYREAVGRFDIYLKAKEYFNNRKFLDWTKLYENLQYEIIRDLKTLNLKDDYKDILLKFYNYRVLGREVIDLHNEKFVEREGRKIYKYLNPKNKINIEQSKAIAINEDRTLLIAGAGTGKTTTIIAKIRYLREKLHIDSGQILLLSFNKSVVDELKFKLNEDLGGISIFTFHALGLSIVSKVLGKQPEVAFDEGRISLNNFLNERFERLILENGYQANVLNYFFNYLHRREIVPKFETLDQYYQYLKNVAVVTFQKESVKSLEEAFIANFFYQNNIKYLYKTPYKSNLVGSQRVPYKPTFYLPDHNLYIEYFAVNRDGGASVAKNKAQNLSFLKKYNEEMRFKRQVHRDFNTNLIEVNYYEFIEDTWESNLTKKLSLYNVRLSPVTKNEIINKLKEGKYISKFIEFCEVFLSLAKSGGFTIQDLKEASEGQDHGPIFMQLFLPLFESYEIFLKDNEKIDFHDMLSSATEYLKNNLYISPYRYIFIDEFQDFSLSKYNLVKALCDQSTQIKLFCVGDDWQSIYRFSGADVSLMSNFEEYFGFTRRAFLQETHRFNDKIAELSNEFILQNPLQIKKKVKSSVRTLGKVIEILYKANVRDNRPLIDILKRLQNQALSTSSSYQVLLLGRYNDENPDDFEDLEKNFKNLKIKFLTIHRSKGLEADFVVVLNAVRGEHGFPSELVDNPLLSIVLRKGEEFPFAEERRLMYVALTRARNKVFIITTKGKESQFISELQNAAQSVEGKDTKVFCKSCNGKMVTRTGHFGKFLGCSNYPLCDHTVNLRENKNFEQVNPFPNNQKVF